MKFSALNISEATLAAINELGYKSMTPIQEESIPVLLAGKDIIGQAKTGTGKTAAFTIPIVEQISPNDLRTNERNAADGSFRNGSVKALVLCPTRELALQVAEDFNALLKHHQRQAVALVGGQKIDTQKKALDKKPSVVVGTPGRVLDHLKQRSLVIKDAFNITLDEADKMLEMGFREDIEAIFAHATNYKQMALFSATMQPSILELARKYQKKSQHINLTKQDKQELKINQTYCEIDTKDKVEAIKRFMAANKIRSAIVFCNTRSFVDRVYHELKDHGFSVSNLHGQLEQRKRDAIMRKFREGDSKILVATDIAARGIDVDDVEAVFNYNLPRESEDYIHRVGRTGRAGKDGLAITLISHKEVKFVKDIAKRHSLNITHQGIPSIQSLGISSLISLEDALIDSTLANKTAKKLLKAIRKEQKENELSDEASTKVFLETKKYAKVFGTGLRG